MIDPEGILELGTVDVNLAVEEVEGGWVERFDDLSREEDVDVDVGVGGKSQYPSKLQEYPLHSSDDEQSWMVLGISV